MFRRRLVLPPHPPRSFFLWGPRQTGKSTLLRATYPGAIWIDLLKTDEFARYAQRPAFLREEVLAAPARALVVIDEVQKVPALLDEVHWLIPPRRVPRTPASPYGGWHRHPSCTHVRGKALGRRLHRLRPSHPKASRRGPIHPRLRRPAALAQRSPNYSLTRRR